MTRPDRPLISVVFSFRNEADNIPTLTARLDAMFAGEQVDHEVIFVNDASTDASLSLLMAERQRNPRIIIVNMSRRFGVAEGVLAGMATARGDAVVYMDADLQDPPEVIPALIGRWREGADVVHTVRTRRHGEHPLKMAATRMAYRLIQLGSSIELPVDAGDFQPRNDVAWLSPKPSGMRTLSIVTGT
jgi:dolichol-phosphate mannosyltransferase